MHSMRVLTLSRTPALSKIDGDATTGLKVVEDVLATNLGVTSALSA